MTLLSLHKCHYKSVMTFAIFGINRRRMIQHFSGMYNLFVGAVCSCGLRFPIKRRKGANYGR